MIGRTSSGAPPKRNIAATANPRRSAKAKVTNGVIEDPLPAWGARKRALWRWLPGYLRPDEPKARQERASAQRLPRAAGKGPRRPFARPDAAPLIEHRGRRARSDRVAGPLRAER